MNGRLGTPNGLESITLIMIAASEFRKALPNGINRLLKIMGSDTIAILKRRIFWLLIWNEIYIIAIKNRGAMKLIQFHGLEQ